MQDDDDVAVIDPGEQRRVTLWAVVLFNTRTRRKYPAPGGVGWCPGDEVALQQFTDAALDGYVAPYFRSLEKPPMSAPAIAPPGVVELVGATFSREAVEPVTTGFAEVLLFLYAPWCSHSLRFVPLWYEFAASMMGATVLPNSYGTWPKNFTMLEYQNDNDRWQTIPGGRLLLAQMDATQNEHPDLPPVERFPTVLLGVRSVAKSLKNLTKGKTKVGKFFAGGDVPWPNYSWKAAPSPSDINFITYTGELSLRALRKWVGENSAFTPPLLDTEVL